MFGPFGGIAPRSLQESDIAKSILKIQARLGLEQWGAMYQGGDRPLQGQCGGFNSHALHQITSATLRVASGREPEHQQEADVYGRVG